MGVILPHGAASWEPVAAAAATVLAALVLAALVGRLMRETERRLRDRRELTGLDAAGETRLRFLRRLVFAAIVAAGFFLALLQFDSFDRLASTALASGALLTAILGFAARESLSNVISGITIAITQPVRVGDHVELADVVGVVEDVTLTYTWVRTPDDGRIAVPNQILTTRPLRNDSIREHAVEPAAAVWVRADADETAALGALLAIDGAERASIDDVTPEGIRLLVAGAPVAASARGEAEGRLRAAALQALRAAGVPRAGTERDA